MRVYLQRTSFIYISSLYFGYNLLWGMLQNNKYVVQMLECLWRLRSVSTNYLDMSHSSYTIWLIKICIFLSKASKLFCFTSSTVYIYTLFLLNRSVVLCVNSCYVFCQRVSDNGFSRLYSPVRQAVVCWLVVVGGTCCGYNSNATKVFLITPFSAISTYLFKIYKFF